MSDEVLRRTALFDVHRAAGARIVPFGGYEMPVQYAGILAEHDISIDAVLQRESAEGEKQTDLIILTHDTVEGRMTKARAQMQALPTVLAPIVRIRKEELN